MNKNSFERKKRQFKNLSEHINQLLQNRQWDQLSASVKAKLIAKLNSLYQLISNYFSVTAIQKVLAAAAVFIALPFISRSQTFDPPQLNPFGYVPPETTLVSPVFADIDGDQDLDLFIGDYEGVIHFYKNIGTTTSPEFDTAQLNPFGLALTSDISFMSVADIDSDGDIDFFVGGAAGNIQFLKNNGTPSSPAFTFPVLNPFGFTPTLEFAIPTFADIDNDGDLDLFVCEYPGAMKFYENTGTAQLAHFATPEPDPFGITPAYGFGAPVFADLDHDGDLDLLEGEYYGNMRYFENTGTNSSPAFAAPLTNPFGIMQTVYYAFPALADLDGDGDFDLTVGEEYGNIQYFENTDFNVGIPEIQPVAAFELYPNPATDKVVLTLDKINTSLPAKIVITDVQGNLLEQRTINTQITTLKTDQFPAGVYFVQMVRDGKSSARKLIVK